MVNAELGSTLSLSPGGNLYIDTEDCSETKEKISQKELEKILHFFEGGYAPGLLRLGLLNTSLALPSSFLFWQKFVQRFITEICKLVDTSNIPQSPSETDLREFIVQAPFMKGIEYLSIEILLGLWKDLYAALLLELKPFGGNLQDYLSAYNAAWNLLGRVCFHLAENKENEETPFAFLATYTSKLSQNSQAQHLPLGRALQEYAGEKNKPALLSLLLPVQKASQKSILIKELVDSGEIFQPLAWKVSEAHRFLKDIPLFESAGIVVRVPNWWNAKKPPRPQIKVSIGEEQKSILGMNTLLNFNMQFALANGEKISNEEWENILASSEGLIKIKGQWVEVDSEKLQQVLSHWKKVQKQVKEGLSFAEGMRLLSGASLHTVDESHTDVQTAEWSFVTAGDWLMETLDNLRNPSQDKNNKNKPQDRLLEKVLKNHLKANLRAYQHTGVQWLWLLYNLKLGGCLADDMGLGKTIQVLSLLLWVKHQHDDTDVKVTKSAGITGTTGKEKIIKKPNLLIVPASLLGNWEAEIKHFAPSLKYWIVHSSAMQETSIKEINKNKLAEVDLVISTYSFSHRLLWLAEVEWNILVLDEAQLIKNPTAKQTRTIKTLKSQVRFTLTGTPIENRLSDLWSLFDFTVPGLLGSAKIFSDQRKKHTKNSDSDKTENNAHFYASLRRLVSPYILRRLKSDKSIISDLPDKTELQTFCALTKQQAGLYQQAVIELTQKLREAEGMQRRGLVLSYLMRFKQICNHPAQLLGHGTYDAYASGKFLRLQEICEQIAAKQEKVLIFTQFREIIPSLTEFLTTVFKREGLVLHGGTSVKQRIKLVEAFQQEEGAPFFVLSLKAGGTGLNLTRASHVIHFDRWWNPSVENQATDRAYRIGQKKNVLVHKFICRGTIEEKIDELIYSKKGLSQEILSGDQETMLTELNNEELIKVVTLDIHRALEDN